MSSSLYKDIEEDKGISLMVIVKQEIGGSGKRDVDIYVLLSLGL